MNTDEDNENLAEPQFIRLFLSHEQKLRTYARSLLPDWQAVDDVIQASSIVIWKKLKKLDSEEGFLSWARTIVRYECLHYLRKCARDRLVLSEETVLKLAEEADLPDERTLNHERKALEFCLRKLSEENRLLVLAPYRTELSVVSIAKESGHSTNSLYKKIGRIREKLRICIQGQITELIRMKQST
jgi:RNA polymerase sigma-70 factor (ECF subfamily)